METFKSFLFLLITTALLTSCGGGGGGGGGTPVVDVTSPVISMSGNNPDSVVVNNTYTDPGALATDNIDGSVNVSMVSTVNTSVIGVYTITYTASDKAGNKAMAIRTVNVTAKLDQNINFGLNTTVNRISSAFTRTATGNFSSSSPGFSSSNQAVATIGVSNGFISIVGAGTTTITVDYPSDSNYNHGLASFTLTVKPDIYDFIVGIPINKGNEAFYNTATSRVEATTGCAIGLTNSTKFAHYLVSDYTLGTSIIKNALFQCGPGHFYGNLPNQVDGQVTIHREDKASDVSCLYIDRFASNTGNPSLGDIGISIPLGCDIALGSATQTFIIDTNTREVTRKIYNEDNGAGVKVLTATDRLVTKGILPVGTRILGVEAWRAQHPLFPSSKYAETLIATQGTVTGVVSFDHK